MHRNYRVKTVVRTGVMSRTDDFLSPKEMVKFETIPIQKRSEWVLGRFCAKKAVSELCVELGDLHLPLSIIHIENTEVGVPFAHIEGTAQYEPMFLSISHTQDRAVAVAALKSEVCGVGVDIERIQHFREDTVCAFLTDTEYSAYLKSSNKQRFATVHWCIKEAYLKALGEGLRIHPRRIEILSKNEDFTELTLARDGMVQNVQIGWTTIEDLYILVTILLL